MRWPWSLRRQEFHVCIASLCAGTQSYSQQLKYYRGKSDARSKEWPAHRADATIRDCLDYRPGSCSRSQFSMARYRLRHLRYRNLSTTGPVEWIGHVSDWVMGITVECRSLPVRYVAFSGPRDKVPAECKGSMGCSYNVATWGKRDGGRLTRTIDFASSSLVSLAPWLSRHRYQ